MRLQEQGLREEIHSFFFFIADAAFLYLWAKLGDRRDHPDDIYILPLKIRRYEIDGKIKTILARVEK